ncbi:butyrate kinase [Gudongella sp. DL1XJH-153]|uniref:butyrate kinase n=1 Tax=Gudongella sp. DL1XJH-153 TaxID=3409804 RepID=UPI003BB5AAFE
MERKYVLAINPGSTSTKVSVFKGQDEIKTKKLDHMLEELNKFDTITDQYEYRMDIILDWLQEEEILPSQLECVVGRGGLLKSMPSGTYKVTETMAEDLKIGVQGQHASNLGGLLARGIADREEIPSFIVDPVAVDEFHDVARISGQKAIERKSLVHALNIKAVCHRYAIENKTTVDKLNVIVAHLGGGITVSPILKGKIVDANNANQMGPFSPERAGGLPVGDVVKMCFSGEYTEAEMKKMIQGRGGLMSYLGTFDGREVIERIESGDEYAKLVYDAMAYQIGKEIGLCGPVLKGDIQGIILTGGLAYSQYLVDYIKDMVSFMAPVTVYPGEDEMMALNKGARRVLDGEENFKIYEEEVE